MKQWISRLGLLLAFASHGVCQDAGDAFQKFEPEVRKAVDSGLEALLSLEREDGTFPDEYGRSTGISSLVGMAFLSTGATPGNGRYGEAINRRIDYALKYAGKEGVITAGEHGNGPMYAHNISTLFLSECSGMVDADRQKKIDETLPKAVGIILRAQAVKKDERHQGGWRYHPGSPDSDMSCSGWALMALRSARLNGAGVPPSAIDSAVKYVLRNQDAKSGSVGYQDEQQHKDSLTGAGLLCLELCGRHAAPESLLAAEWILRHHTKLRGGQFELYGNYYNAQGMFQMGGKYWKTYAEWMYATYLAQQKADGTWESDGERGKRPYSTSLMILAMTVPFRQLPIYQRDERVDEE
ncbi:MAG: terpene cyclase/mutase family protein [Verrucomicrobiales bacterium]|nr:terpene cyclase/mutase family protein [Verrucomicrobiales bacterium]